jgi:ABC-type nitrate/sulfonate/bicarbonate transport system substrate-binding protein
MAMKKKTRILLVSVLFLISAGDAALALENVRVAYPSMNNSVFCLIIAQKEGYLKEEGLNVELLSIRGEIAIRTTLAGEVDFFTNAGSALAAAVRGVPVKILTVFQDKPSWDLIAQPNIKSIAQLRGANVAIMSPEGSLAVVAREILKQNGLDPAKDVNLVVMGGDEVRYPAMKGKAIQASLFNTSTSILAQKEGFTKLASAGDYANLIQSGLSTSEEKIKQNPKRIHGFIRAALKGMLFFLAKREAAIKYMMDALRLKERELANTIYDIDSKLILREGMTGDKVLQSIIDDMKKATKVQREIKTADIFDLSFVRKANEELKAAGWKP